MVHTDSVIASNISKIYKSGRSLLTACAGINFTAEYTKITGLLGPNGAGKSTFLKIASGLQYPTAGTLCSCGFTDLSDIRRITGYVGDTAKPDPLLTVHEVLYETAMLHGLTGIALQDGVRNAERISALETVAKQKASTLSKGFLQRLSLAKALCFSPNVLILDEFSGGLDPSQTARLRKEVRSLAAHSIVIVSTHNMAEAQSLCDDIYIVNAGTVCAHGSTERLMKESGTHSLEEAFLYYTEGGSHEADL